MERGQQAGDTLWQPEQYPLMRRVTPAPRRRRPKRPPTSNAASTKPGGTSKGSTWPAALMTLAVGTLAYLLVGAVIDQWLVPGGLGFWGRFLLMAGLLGAGGWYFYRHCAAAALVPHQSDLRRAGHRTQPADAEEQPDQLPAAPRASPRGARGRVSGPRTAGGHRPLAGPRRNGRRPPPGDPPGLRAGRRVCRVLPVPCPVAEEYDGLGRPHPLAVGRHAGADARGDRRGRAGRRRTPRKAKSSPSWPRSRACGPTSRSRSSTRRPTGRSSSRRFP